MRLNSLSPQGACLLAALVLLWAARATPVFAQENTLHMQVADQHFEITLADTEAARAFAALLPLALEMSELNGNEKYATLPQSLPTHAYPPGHIEAGDVMLYGTDTIVVFYESFRTGYRYTRLGRVRNAQNLAQALGTGSAQVRFSAEQ